MSGLHPEVSRIVRNNFYRTKFYSDSIAPYDKQIGSEDEETKELPLNEDSLVIHELGALGVIATDFEWEG